MNQGRSEASVASVDPRSVDTPSAVAGWKEWVGLPEFGMGWVKAKFDTGARSSAIHATDIELFDRDGVEMVRFTTCPWQGSCNDAVTLELPVVDTRQVRSSTGHTQVRTVIRTDVTIGDQTYTTELTLSNRTKMGLRILIGRQAMAGQFVVDSGRAYLFGRPPRTIRDRNRAGS